jgi:hypothetical protein
MKMFISGILAISLAIAQAAAQSAAHISVHLEGVKPTDTVTLIYWNKSFGDEYLDRFTPQIWKTASMGQDHLFHFEVDVTSKIGHFAIFNRRNAHFNEPILLMKDYPIEPSDNVAIRFTHDTTFDHLLSRYRAMENPKANENFFSTQFKITFSGIGAEKYAFKYMLDHAEKDTASYLNASGIYTNTEKESTRQLDKYLGILDSVRPKMSPLAFQVTKADIVAAILSAKYSNLSWWLPLGSGRKSQNPSFPSNIRSTFSAHFLSDTILTNQIPLEARALSSQFISYILLKAKLTKQVLYDQDSTVSPLILVNRDYIGELKEKAMVKYAYVVFNHGTEKSGSGNVNEESVLKECHLVVKTPFWRDMLDGLTRSQAAGEPAYNFELPDTSGRIVHLSDFKGKVVFIDFWYTGCENCASFYQNHLSKVEKRLKDNPDVVFITISIDRKKEGWIKSINNGEYTSTSAVNLYTGGSGSDHPLIRHYNVSAYPHPILLDRQGRVYQATDLRGTSADTTRELGNNALINTITRALTK